MPDTARLTWIWDPAPPSGRRSGGNAAWRAFTPTIETFVREVLQNAKDAGESRRVRVRFRLIELSEQDTSHFLDALEWERSLQPHLEAVAEEPNGAVFREGLENLQDSDRLILLLVEDSNTAGLVGPESGRSGEEGNFAGLCKDELYSAKGSDTAGGSHGMGKAVLWLFSRFSTVLFNSTLSERPEGRENPRLIGRASLPWHEVSAGEAFDGGGWFGIPESGESRAVSAWSENARAVAERLYLNREIDNPGTSIVVVGFREPAEADRPLEDVATDIEEATAKWFWPSMLDDDPELSVSVEVIRDSQQEYAGTVEVDQFDEVKPFVEAYRAFRNDAIVDSLVQPGDVVARTIELDLPEHKAGDHSPVTAETSLIIRLAAPAEAQLNESDTVACFRGAGMVVKYRSLRRLSLTARPYHAALVCGTANGSDIMNVWVDRFLRAAEPPEHTEWDSTPALKETYSQPYKSALTDLNKRVREELRRALSQQVQGGERGPERLMRRFNVGGIGGGGGGKVEFDLVRASASLNEDGLWEFRGTMRTRVDVPNGWRAYIVARLANEDNSTANRVTIRELSAATLRCLIDQDKATVMVPPDTTSFDFHGTVDARRYAVEPQLSTLSISATGARIG